MTRKVGVLDDPNESRRSRSSSRSSVISSKPTQRPRAQSSAQADSPKLSGKQRPRAQSESTSLLAKYRRSSSIKKNQIASRTSEIYEKGAKFQRFSSGRVCRIGSSGYSSSSSTVTDDDAQAYLRKMAQQEAAQDKSSSSNNLSIPPNARSVSSTSTAEVLMCKQSYQSFLGPLSSRRSSKLGMQPTTKESTAHNKNSVLLRGVPSPNSTLSILNDDLVVSHLVGDYDEFDKKAFAEKITDEIQCLADLSTESMIEFLMSEEYKYWLKEKTKEWKKMPSNKKRRYSGRGEVHSNKKANEWEKMNSNLSFQASYLPEKKSDEDNIGIGDTEKAGSGSSIIQIFQDCGGGEGGEHCVGVHNHYNYEIKINTRGESEKQHGLLNSCFSKSCCIL